MSSHFQPEAVVQVNLDWQLLPGCQRKGGVHKTHVVKHPGRNAHLSSNGDRHYV